MFNIFTADRAHSQVVRDAWLWRRKSSEDCEIAPRFRHPTTGKWVPFFESGKDKAAKGGG